MMKKMLIPIALTAACVLHAETFRIEGEDLAVTQGKVQIGKHALAFSGGKSVTVTAKETTLEGACKLEKAGKYQVWIRTFTQGGKWRNGELSINGQSLGKFGDEPLKEGEKAHWGWIKLKEAELPAGKIEFKIFSKMGYVRVDAILLTDDESYTPPEKAADIVKVPALKPYQEASAPKE